MISFVRSSLVRALLAFAPLTPLTTTAQVAQGQLRPLTADPARAVRPAAHRQAAAHRVAALPLPFFDDFANARYGPRPDPVLWDTTGGALRNETFARQPPSRGVITFDGLDGNGRSYGVGSGATDTLTSQPIDLTGSANVVLSFWLQAGGAGDPEPPSSAHTLTLDFDDGSGFWDLDQWHQNGPSVTTAFEQVFVTVPALYLTNNFRFRFRTRGSRQGSINIWSLDYVVLDANRQPQPGPVRDVAFSQFLTSPLKRFTAMPVWQFNAAANPADELADSVRTTINNLEPDPLAVPTPLADQGWLTTRDFSGSIARVDTFLTETRTLDPDSLQVPLVAALRPALPPAPVISPDYKTITSKLVLYSGEPDPRTLFNDTIQRAATLATYYAADDGSPEVVYSLRNTTDPVAAAIGFDLNTPDQVAGVEIYLGGDIPTGTRLFADVWADDPMQAGRPAPTSLSHVSFLVPGDSILQSLGRWWPVYFPPVSVTGRFYVGYSQPATTVISSIGFDLSDSLATTGRFFARVRTDPWRAEPIGGALMVRALMNNNGLLGLPTAAVAPAPRLSVFPNPVSTSGVAELHLPTGLTTTVTLHDALGRVVRTVPAGAPVLSVRGLAPGVYVLRLAATETLRTVRVLVTD